MVPEKADEQSKTPPSENKLELEHTIRARRVLGGRVVITPEGKAPYKVVLQYFDGEQTEHPFQTVREGEDFIRGEFPVPKGTSRPLRTPPT
jgi:hypothetical protein